MHTKVAIAYMQNIANDDLVTEVKRRLETIKTDALMPPGYIQEFIEDTSFSPFPQQLNTERPDRVAANLMEGRVAILSDGDPTALIVPVTLFAFYQSPDDYNNRPDCRFFRPNDSLSEFLDCFSLTDYIYRNRSLSS